MELQPIKPSNDKITFHFFITSKLKIHSVGFLWYCRQRLNRSDKFDNTSHFRSIKDLSQLCFDKIIFLPRICEFFLIFDKFYILCLIYLNHSLNNIC